MSESDLPPAAFRNVRPNWRPDDEATICSGCTAKFNLIRRKHHCRNCGEVFCSSCSNYQRTIPKLNYRYEKMSDTLPNANGPFTYQFYVGIKDCRLEEIQHGLLRSLFKDKSYLTFNMDGKGGRTESRILENVTLYKWHTGFKWETKDLDELKEKELRVFLTLKPPREQRATPNEHHVVAEVKVPIWVLATGPVHHSLPLMDDQGTFVARVHFAVVCEQFSNVAVVFQELSCHDLKPMKRGYSNPLVDISYSRYTFNYPQRTLTAPKQKHTLNPQWIHLSPLRFTATYKEMIGEWIDVNVQHHSKFDGYRTIGRCKLVLKNILTDDALVRFNGPITSLVGETGRISGVATFKFLPVLAQMAGGVHTERGIFGGAHVLPAFLRKTFEARPDTKRFTEEGEPIDDEAANDAAANAAASKANGGGGAEAANVTAGHRQVLRMRAESSYALGRAAADDEESSDEEVESSSDEEQVAASKQQRAERERQRAAAKEEKRAAAKRAKKKAKKEARKAAAAAAAAAEQGSASGSDSGSDDDDDDEEAAAAAEESSEASSDESEAELPTSSQAPKKAVDRVKARAKGRTRAQSALDTSASARSPLSKSMAGGGAALSNSVNPSPVTKAAKTSVGAKHVPVLSKPRSSTNAALRQRRSTVSERRRSPSNARTNARAKATPSQLASSTSSTPSGGGGDAKALVDLFDVSSISVQPSEQRQDPLIAAVASSAQSDDLFDLLGGVGTSSQTSTPFNPFATPSEAAPTKRARAGTAAPSTGKTASLLDLDF